MIQTQLYRWFAIRKENKLVIKFKVVEIHCSTCTKSKGSPAGFPVLVILIFFFFGIRIVWVFLHNPHPTSFHWNENQRHATNLSQISTSEEHFKDDPLPLPPYYFAEQFNSNHILKTGPKVFKSGEPEKQLLQDRICHSPSHHAIFAHPKRLQLILPPASNTILENSTLF